MTLLVLVLALAVAALLVATLLLAFLLRVARHRADEAEQDASEKYTAALMRAGEDFKKREVKVREDAIKRSKAVVTGKVFEHLVPFTEGFGYNPRDVRFLGSPVDFLIFEGLSEGEVDRVVFVEVKTGLSRLSKRERQVAEAIRRGDVDYEEVRL